MRGLGGEQALRVPVYIAEPLFQMGGRRAVQLAQDFVVRGLGQDDGGHGRHQRALRARHYPASLFRDRAQLGHAADAALAALHHQDRGGSACKRLRKRFGRQLHVLRQFQKNSTSCSRSPFRI